MIAAGIGFVLGSILGSFTAASAGRILKNESLQGRSYCQRCKSHLRWYDLVPVFSFLALKGKCRTCRKKIPPENFLAEILLGAVVALLFAVSLPGDLQALLIPNGQNLVPLLNLIFKLFVITVLSVVFLVDLKSGLIHDRITFPATVIASFYLLINSTFKSWFFYQDLLQNPLGAYLLPPNSGYLFDNIFRIWQPALFALLSAIAVSAFFALLIIITKGKGMGWGDVKFVLFLGLALGFPGIALAIFLAFILGAVFSLGLIALRKKHFGQTIPFGPFLSLGTLIYILWGPTLVNWYLTLF